MVKLSLVEKLIRQYRLNGCKGVVDRVKYRLQTKIHPMKLQAVGVELTNVCNLRCSFCFVDKKRERGFMKYDLFRKVVDEAAELKVSGVGLNYNGESLCHPEFKRFLKYAMKLRQDGASNQVAWVDNGMLFSHDISDLVVELGVDGVSFSLEGFAEVNDKTRVGCDYEKVKDNILYLLKARGKRKKPVVCVNTLNLNGDMDFIKFWMRHVDVVSWSPLRDMDNQLLNPKFYDRLREVFQKLDERNKKEVESS